MKEYAIIERVIVLLRPIDEVYLKAFKPGSRFVIEARRSDGFAAYHESEGPGQGWRFYWCDQGDEWDFA